MLGDLKGFTAAAQGERTSAKLLGSPSPPSDYSPLRDLRIHLRIRLDILSFSSSAAWAPDAKPRMSAVIVTSFVVWPTNILAHPIRSNRSSLIAVIRSVLYLSASLLDPDGRRPGSSQKARRDRANAMMLHSTYRWHFTPALWLTRPTQWDGPKGV